MKLWLMEITTYEVFILTRLIELDAYLGARFSAPPPNHTLTTKHTSWQPYPWQATQHSVPTSTTTTTTTTTSAERHQLTKCCQRNDRRRKQYRTERPGI